MNTSARRYAVEFGGAMAAYVVVLFVSILILQNVDTGVLRYLVAVLPVVPAGFAILAYLRHLRRLDELQRRIQLEALAVSFAASALITFTVGFLENAGVPRPSWIWVAPLMIGLWGLGSFLANRRYS